MENFILPKDIEKEAKEFMEEIIKKLEDMGVLEDCNKGALTMLARNYSVFVLANKTLAKEGLTVHSDRGNIAEHPCVKIARDAQASAMKVMTEFGLTAKSKTKVKAKEKNDDDAFTSFIKNK